MNTVALRLTPLALLALAAACGGEDAGTGCKADQDCPAGFVCLDGDCKCRTDDSCPSGQYCNPYGTCQPRPACLGNDDCNPGFICNAADPTGGKCIPADTCGSSVHCPFNQFCNPSTQRCTPGCRSTGDCQLGWVCSAGQCTPGGTAGDCTTCPASPAPDPTYCDYGETCSAQGACVAHPQRAGLCQACGEALPDCASQLTCLVDDTTANDNYCAPSCVTGADCPSGYEGCGGLSIVTGECGGGVSGPCDCTRTGTCPNGGRCVGGGEGARAYCECVSQDDCNFLAGACGAGLNICLTDFSTPCVTDEDCGCAGGRCLVGGFPCNTGADCRVSCVQVPYLDDSIGMCETNARACGKGEGVSCQELTQGVAECRAPGG